MSEHRLRKAIDALAVGTASLERLGHETDGTLRKVLINRPNHSRNSTHRIGLLSYWPRSSERT
jgi:hypothetical protein